MKNYVDQGGCCCFPVKTNKKKTKSYYWQAKCELAVVFLVRVVSATLHTV